MIGPEISVIVPTYNRKDSLLATLDSLGRQTYSSDRFEVIVIDDGGMDGTEEILGLDFPFDLRYFWQENQGEIAARHLGVAEAQSDLLAFIDDDIILSDRYLEALVRAHQVFPGHLVIGAIHPHYFTSVDDPVRYLAMEKLPSDHEVVEVPYFEVCSHSLLLSRHVFVNVGGMLPLDDGRNAWGGVDLGYRAYRQGYRVYRARTAVGIHNDRSMRSFSSEALRWEHVCTMAVLLLQRYPELQGQIPMLRDKERINWASDSLALVGKKLVKLVLSLPGVIEVVDAIVTSEILKPWQQTLQQWGLEPHMVRGFRKGMHTLVVGGTDKKGVQDVAD